MWQLRQQKLSRQKHFEQKNILSKKKYDVMKLRTAKVNQNTKNNYNAKCV